MPALQTLERFIALVESNGSATHLEELAYQRLDGERIAEEQFFYDPGQLAAS
jgi:hypothetical protein